ncbi:MAG: SEC-C metal-binding domain-containing protein [Velocimicrobium sp.]
MANLQLKKSILEVVDNQLKDNNPACTKDVYEKLLDAGYSKSEAKDKIAAVVLTEIYDILKVGKSFDEARYQRSLEEMLQQSLDFEDNHHIETEWDEWDKLVQNGYECIGEQKLEEGLNFWKEAWLIFQSIMEQQYQMISLLGLIEELDYIYAIDGWLQDYEMELGNAQKYEERIAFCQKIMELFDWQDYDDSCFQCGIGDSLFYEGKKEEAYSHYEKWLAEDPQNSNGINGFCWILFENGDAEKAYSVVRRVTWGVSCNVDNSILFMRAKQLADYVGKPEEGEWYQQQLDKLEESFQNWEMNEDDIFDEFTAPKQIPVVKMEKIYPNDPCPCGSGKKYKKCCGRN